MPSIISHHLFPVERATITQQHNTGSHVGKGLYAWDFGIPVGSIITAVDDGIVLQTRDDSTSGGCDAAFANDANYVTIKHSDDTVSLYLHLAPGSVLVKPGDSVQRGDRIGKIGLTGWVCGAHLHFQIQEDCGSWWCQSVPATFEEYGDPVLNTYLSGICLCESGYYGIATCDGHILKQCVDGEKVDTACEFGCAQMNTGVDDYCQPDPCLEISCSNHGHCAVVENKATCSCDSGYHADALNCIKNIIDPVDPEPEPEIDPESSSDSCGYSSNQTTPFLLLPLLLLLIIFRKKSYS